MMSTLPLIRPDLTLDSTPTFIDGQPTYLLVDPIKNQYFRISKKTLIILQNWQTMAPEEFLECLNQNLELQFTPEDIKQCLEFLSKNQLLVTNVPDSITPLLNELQQKRGHWIKKIIHHYLFFKVPLAKPDEFLSKTLKYLHFFFTKSYLYFLGFIFLIGFYLTLQQWSNFFQPFDYFFGWKGALYIFLGMSIIKSVHELGHAYAAKYYGCHVSSIGVAFLVMFPILYTDTSDAWRLKNPRHRLWIDCAGVISELHLMIWMLFLWHLVDSPVLKSIFVYAISVGVVSTLMVNLNPMMRFDGYYALSNFLNIENLQPHSFALARWKLRALLLGLHEPAPFRVSSKKLHIMLIYAYIVWIYRFIVFTGIAFLVYHMFFKLLGIFLFGVEIYYFVLGPIVSELLVYFKHIKDIQLNRRILTTASVLAALLFILLFPWRATLVVPAVLTFEIKEDIYTDVDSYAEAIPFNNRTSIMKNSLIFLAQSPDLVYEKKLTGLKIEQIKTKIRQQQGLGQQLGGKQADKTELKALENQLKNILEEQARLNLPAPFKGFIYNRAPNILPYRWYRANTYLFSIAQPEKWVIKAYIPEYELGRIDYIKEPLFLSNNADTPPIQLNLLTKPLSRVENLDNPYLASIYGGDLAVFQPTQKNPHMELKESYYEFSFESTTPINFIQYEQRGVVIMKVARESFIKRILQHVVAIFIRESSFS